MLVSGAGVREIVRDGTGSSRGGMGTIEGRRGGRDSGLYFGGSGRVIEGAGLGEGMDLKESRDTLKEQ